MTAPTPPAESRVEARREALVRIMYDAWPHTVISPALEQATGFPSGTVLTFDKARDCGCTFDGLYRYADAVIAGTRAPASADDTALREAREVLAAVFDAVDAPTVATVLRSDFTGEFAPPVQAALNKLTAALTPSPAQSEQISGWQTMDSAPKDGTEFWALSDDVRHKDLPPFVSKCAWHPDAGFCTDELREPVLWKPFSAAPESNPQPDSNAGERV